MHGEQLKFKQRELVMPSCRCQFNITLISRNTKLSHQSEHLILLLKLYSTVEISLTLITSVVQGKSFFSFEHISYLTQMFIHSSWVNTRESIRSGLAVLDVTIPTGYIIQQQKLDSYILSKRVRNLQRAKFEEKKVLFFFEFVSFRLKPENKL